MDGEEKKCKEKEEKNFHFEKNKIFRFFSHKCTTNYIQDREVTSKVSKVNVY